MKKISALEAERIGELRRTGHSLPEIREIIGRGKGTIFRYAHSVTIAPEFVEIHRAKQGGSRARSAREWEKARGKAALYLGKLSSRDKILILAGLYWGEGTKRELNIINGDASLLRVFIICLGELGVLKENLRISLRLFEDIEEHRARMFWARELGVSAKAIRVS